MDAAGSWACRSPAPAFSVYVLSGALAGCAGVFLASQDGSVDTAAGQGWELSAIAAVVVGGTLLTGGVGSVLSTLVGVLLLQLIFNLIVFENGKHVINHQLVLGVGHPWRVPAASSCCCRCGW